MEEGAENLKASESHYPIASNRSVRNTAHTLRTQGNNKAENPALFHALFKEKTLKCHFVRSLWRDWIPHKNEACVSAYTQIKMEKPDIIEKEKVD